MNILKSSFLVEPSETIERQIFLKELHISSIAQGIAAINVEISFIKRYFTIRGNKDYISLTRKRTQMIEKYDLLHLDLRELKKHELS